MSAALSEDLVGNCDRRYTIIALGNEHMVILVTIFIPYNTYLGVLTVYKDHLST